MPSIIPIPPGYEYVSFYADESPPQRGLARPEAPVLARVTGRTIFVHCGAESVTFYVELPAADTCVYELPMKRIRAALSEEVDSFMRARHKSTT